MKIIICCIGWILCGYSGVVAFVDANGAIQQIIGCIASLMSALFLIGAFVLHSIEQLRASNETNLKLVAASLSDLPGAQPQASMRVA